MNETPSRARLPSLRARCPIANSYAPMLCSGRKSRAPSPYTPPNRRGFEEREDWLCEIVPPRDDPLHVVLLVLHGAEQHRVRQVDHAGHSAPPRPEQHPLALGRTVDDVFGCAQIEANEL